MTKSIEDYLEAIYRILDGKKVARVTEISARMRVSKPSVVGALKTLDSLQYIKREKYGYVELTPVGHAEAKKIFRRHVMIKKFLIAVLGISEANAEKDACAMEHVLTNETLLKIAAFQQRIA